ncbi:metallophosphoesterase [Hyphococcus flavus]|uniref:Metallophosphoesterase n=1 Tax=Hyphococcus flavus TaxID=1866326 RepID=A0AAE9ZDC4_9PROT|nr:metallophosphoesterase [Hyphococcus flavus]WDI31505.1 metallophosphoesterase [Hyphococcus flavus]
MTRLAHISDIHFGAVDPAAVEALAVHINAAGIDGLVVTGDLTQAGRKDEFRQAAAYLDRFDVPALVVPGNHDTPVYNLGRRFVDPWGRYRQHIHSELNPAINIGEAFVIGLNSARRANLTFDWSLGRLSSRQLDDATKRLRSSSHSKLKLVAFHHPVLPGPGRAGMAVINQPARALSRFAEAGADVLLTGHAHVARAELYKKAQNPLIVTAAGTATSTRLRGEAPSYNLLSWDGRELSVSIHRLSQNGYEQDSTKTFTRKNNSWS